MSDGNDSLAEVIRSSVSSALRFELEAIADLDARARGLYERARAVWGAFEVPAERWAQHVAKHLVSPIEAALDAVHPDLYFAIALLDGRPGALAHFAEVYRPRLRRQLNAMARRARTDDIVAAVEERLLVDSGRGPRLSAYSGRGPLERFVRAVAANELLNSERGVRPEALTPSMEQQLVDGARSPEVTAASRQLRAAFTEALQAAVRSLEAKDRLLLRLHAVEGATIDELGRMFGVHRVTAFRWLEEARLQLRKETRRRLREQHDLGDREVESLLGASTAAIDVSLKSLFVSVAPRE